MITRPSSKPFDVFHGEDLTEEDAYSTVAGGVAGAGAGAGAVFKPLRRSRSANTLPHIADGRKMNDSDTAHVSFTSPSDN